MERTPGRDLAPVGSKGTLPSLRSDPRALPEPKASQGSRREPTSAPGFTTTRNGRIGGIARGRSSQGRPPLATGRSPARSWGAWGDGGTGPSCRRKRDIFGVSHNKRKSRHKLASRGPGGCREGVARYPPRSGTNPPIGRTTSPTSVNGRIDHLARRRAP